MYYHVIITKAKMPDRNSGLADTGGRRYLRLLTSACIECYSIECRKTKTKVRATVNHSMETITTSQSEERKLPSRTNKKSEYKQPTTKTRENAGDQGVVGFSFASDWWKRWREFS